MTVTTPPLDAAVIAVLPRLRRYALVLTGGLQQADDLVLDTLAYASGAHELPQHRTGLATWLFTLMRELHVDESPSSRDGGASTPRGIQWSPGFQRGIPAAGTQSGRSESAETLGRFSGLPVAEREILLLVAVERLAYGEIAALLGVPIATVMSRLNRARANLAAMAVELPMSGKGPS